MILLLPFRKTASASFQPCAWTRKWSARKSLASALSAPSATTPAQNPLSPNSSAAPPPPKIFSPRSSPPWKPTPLSAKSPTPSAASSANTRNPSSFDAHAATANVRDCLAAPREHARRCCPLHRSHWLLCALPRKECRVTIAILRRGKAASRWVGQVRTTHLEVERRAAEKASGFLRKVFQRTRNIYLIEPPAAFPGDAWNWS